MRSSNPIREVGGVSEEEIKEKRIFLFENLKYGG
jgi:hypothetical protein